MRAGPWRIGLIADTHGLLRPAVASALAGVQALIHAGDIGTPDVLDQLGEIAPVHAVRGNNDRGAWAEAIPTRLDLEFQNLRIHVLHDIAELRDAALAGATQVVISGHSHQPRVFERDGRLWVNPGSAGPRRFRLPVTVGELQLRGTKPHARIIPLL